MSAKPPSSPGASAGVLAVELEKVRRVYRDGESERAALDGVSLRVAQGSFVAIVGPSGSGKSTLLGVLGALDRGYEGAVRILGEDLARLGERELGQLRGEKLGFLFQAFHLLPHLSVLGNVMSPALFARSDRGIEQAARRALDRVGLASRADDRPQKLSGGQRQRVALARAMVHNPAILLCDEPTGNLDSATGASIIDLLAGLHSSGVTVVVVTHEERLAERAGRRVTLVDGKIDSDSDPGLPATDSPTDGATGPATEAP
jgi:putative ABC transport system ATP-binding protein